MPRAELLDLFQQALRIAVEEQGSVIDIDFRGRLFRRHIIDLNAVLPKVAPHRSHALRRGASGGHDHHSVPRCSDPLDFFVNERHGRVGYNVYALPAAHVGMDDAVKIQHHIRLILHLPSHYCASLPVPVLPQPPRFGLPRSSTTSNSTGSSCFTRRNWQMRVPFGISVWRIATAGKPQMSSLPQ